MIKRDPKIKWRWKEEKFVYMCTPIYGLTKDIRKKEIQNKG